MKYFIVFIEYKTALENIIRVTDEHRAHLKKGYEAGMFLISGPRIPRTGGIVIAKAKDSSVLEKFFSEDPYSLNSYADYKFIQFNPKSNHELISGWVNTKE